MDGSTPMTEHSCPECGAAWPGGATCEGYFHQMLAWEAEHPDFIPEVHHLMVLCYHLQHPGLYSPEGLAFGVQLLVDFVERGVGPSEIRRRSRGQVDSSRRTWKVTGTAASHGAYPKRVAWPLTAADVIGGGAEQYVANVKAWAKSTLAALRSSGNLASPARPRTS